MSAPRVKIVPLLDVHQLLMLSAETLTYSEPATFSSVTVYNIIIINENFNLFHSIIINLLLLDRFSYLSYLSIINVIFVVIAVIISVPINLVNK
jgi:hypothetical protein